jgi:ABC-type sugar transport system permease subunit
VSDFVVGRNYRRREALLGYGLVLPAFVVFGVFSFYPLLKNFWLTMYQSGDYAGIPSKFVGLHQLFTALTSSTFYDSLRSTAIFVGISVPFGVIGGLFLAALAHQKLRGMAFYRVAFASTITSSLAVGAAVFYLFLNPDFGFLPWIHLNIQPAVLGNPGWALPSVALIQVWQFTGLSFIINIAGMQSINEEVLEAASIDGCGAIRRFVRVTMPLMSGPIYVTIVVAIIGALQGFGQIDVLYGYGPSIYLHTQTLVYLVYNTIVHGQNFGLAACYSTALFVITLVVTIFQVRMRIRAMTRDV